MMVCFHLYSNDAIFQLILFKDTQLVQIQIHCMKLYMQANIYYDEAMALLMLPQVKFWPCAL